MCTIALTCMQPDTKGQDRGQYVYFSFAWKSAVNAQSSHSIEQFPYTYYEKACIEPWRVRVYDLRQLNIYFLHDTTRTITHVLKLNCYFSELHSPSNKICYIQLDI